MKIETSILALAVLLTGIMAGIFFTWSNAVKPGIGKLSDLEYLNSLLSMNRVILNKSFLFLFISDIAVALVPIFHFHTYPNHFGYLIFLIYWAGVFLLIHAFGNIPLNEILDKSNLEAIGMKEIISLRRTIEFKWNNFNLIRSISSAITFILLVFSFVILDK